MHRSNSLVALGTTLLLVGGTSPAALAADPSVTLRFAILGGEDHPMAIGANAFIQEATARSGGSVVIEPVWDAGAGAASGFEQGVARQLVDGEADLALTASRAWDSAGVTSLEVLQAPFLITDDGLAAAVSTSPVADELLAGMADGGITGLAMWPEDLEHFINMGCLDPVVSPDQLDGKVIRSVPSKVMLDVIETLGATHSFYDDYGADGAACKINANVLGFRRSVTLPNAPLTYTGDITLSPKFEVLAVNTTAFDRLTPAQRAALREAAIAARDLAIAQYLPEADAAAAWCAAGGTVVMAGPEGVAAFERALQPVNDRLMSDPVASKAIEAIQALKATVQPAPGAGACEPPGLSTTVAYPHPDLTGYVGTLPADGTYRADVTQEDLLAAGASPLFAKRQAMLYTLTFQGDTATWTEGQRSPCYNDATSDGTMFSIRERVPDTCLGGDYVWREVPGGIELVQLPPPEGVWPIQDVIDSYVLFDRVWTRID